MNVCAKISGWVPRRILACSTRGQTVHVEAGYNAEKIEVIPNGFDLDRFKPNTAARNAVRAELNISPESLLVGLIARDNPQKNILGFIDAAARVHKVLPESHFLLAGLGIDETNLQITEKISSSCLKKHAHLLGRREDIPRLMASLDILVSSSSCGEGFPNVLGEAMACGVPCVVTDVGDSAEIVGSSGRVVEEGNMANLAHNIVDVLQAPLIKKMALGKEARERINSNYKITDVVRRYETFYDELLMEN
jgi:glycosyltransferase involved in cell wall biosynthesis